MNDAVDGLAHDHADLNRRVLDVAARLRALPADADLGAVAPALVELRELLFLHFAREEEGLFPFVADAVPKLSDAIAAMETAHDTICGALARATALAMSGGGVAVVTQLFERFEAAYGEHAAAEARLLETVRGLSVEQRARLAELVERL